MLDHIMKAYSEAVFETDKEAAFDVVDAALADGVRPEDIVFKVVIPAVEEMMSNITKDPDANLAQHFMTAQIAAEVTEKMLEKFEHPPEIIGRVVIGTAHGDLHSLGKRIVMCYFKALMVEVTDLGVNVPAEKFVDEAIAHDAQVIAVSAMMAHTATGETGARRVRQILQERGLADRFRLVDRLYKELDNALSFDDQKDRQTIVFYGACHPKIGDILDKHHTLRTQGQNCIVMLLGYEKFMAELEQGAYFLFEDWALTWEPMITEAFGKNIAVIREIFHSSHKKIIALRTPCSTDFTAAAEAAAAFIDLPLEWLDVDLGHLETVLAEAIERKQHAT